MRRRSEPIFACALWLLSCSPRTDDSPRVCTTYDPSCTPLYEPTFDQVFARTLKPTCAVSANCHASGGKQGRVTFVEPQQAHDALITRELVEPGDAACSKVSVRIASTDPLMRMPPGRSLDPAEVCAIEQWIARGASR